MSLLGEENTFGIVCSRSSPGKIPLLTLNALSLSLFSYSSLVWEDNRGETILFRYRDKIFAFSNDPFLDDNYQC